MLPHAQGERHRAAVDEPRVERRDDAAVVHLVREPDPLRELLARGDRAARGVAAVVAIPHLFA